MFLNQKFKILINSDLFNLDEFQDTPDENGFERIGSIRRRLLSDPEPDSEWCMTSEKIKKLSPDPNNWMNAVELLGEPSSISKKIGDEIYLNSKIKFVKHPLTFLLRNINKARSIAARHVIDRLKEKNLLPFIRTQTPRLRSAVELLSKPDADIVYPAVQFVANQMLEKYPETYSSVIRRVNLRIPRDEEPSVLLVSFAKTILEDSTSGQIEMNWSKLIAILVLGGALAIDCVDSGYPRGVTAIVETFGCLVEQIMAEWIQSVGGWKGFIEETSHVVILPHIVRALLILTVIMFFIYHISPYFNPILDFYPINILWETIKTYKHLVILF